MTPPSPPAADACVNEDGLCLTHTDAQGRHGWFERCNLAPAGVAVREDLGEITPEQARHVVESDPALSLERMLRRMDEQDKAAFNFCVGQAYRVPTAIAPEQHVQWICSTNPTSFERPPRGRDEGKG